MGSIAKFALPMLKTVGRAALGQAVGLAKDVAHDALSGQNVGQALKRRGLQRLRTTASTALRRKRRMPSRKRNSGVKPPA